MIVVGTGCFFSLIFHLGTKEPPQAVVENNKGKTKHFVARTLSTLRTLSLIFDGILVAVSYQIYQGGGGGDLDLS